MLNIDKTQNQLFMLSLKLRGSVGYYNMFSSTIHLLFLKYLLSFSDKFENLGIESYKALSNFKRKYDISKNGGEPFELEDIRQLFRTLDSEYVLKDIKLSDSMRVYDTLFSDKQNQRAILKILDEIDLEFSPDFLRNLLELLIERTSRDVRATGECVTNKFLREIAVKILDIKPNDQILNCFAGFSTLALSMPKDINYAGYELNYDSFTISRMLLTMLGVRNSLVLNQDFLMSDSLICGDKVFSDGPINIRYDNSKALINLGVDTKDGNLLILYKVLRSISPFGVGVIAVPGKVLFSNQSSYIELRKRYQEEGLKAVISLPPLWAGTIINTNLLVVDKKYHGPIMFIDAQNIGTKDRVKNVILSEEDIEKVCNAYKNNEEIPGFSKLVTQEEVDKRQSWQPSFFVQPLIENTARDVKEIDSELNSLYEELMNNLK